MALKHGERIAFILLGLILLVVPLYFERDLFRGFEFAKSFAYRSLVCLLAIAVLAGLGRGRLRDNPYRLPAALFLAGQGLSCLAAVNLAESLDAFALPDYVCHFLLLLAAVQVIRTETRLVQMTLVALGSGLAVAVVGVGQTLGLDVTGLAANRVAISTIGNQNFATYVHDVMLPVAAGLVVGFGVAYRRDRRIRDLAVAAISLLYLLFGAWHVWVAHSRGARLALVAAAAGIVLLLFLLHPAVRRRLSVRGRVLATLAIAAVLLVGALFAGRVLAGSGLWEDPANVFRRESWHAALQKVRDNPILGIGPGNYRIVHPLYASAREWQAGGVDRLARRSHNDYLDKAAEGGVLATVAMLWLAVVAARLLWRNLRRAVGRRDGRFWLSLGHAGALIAIGFHALVEVPLLQPASCLLFLFVLASVAVLARLADDRDEMEASAARAARLPRLLTVSSSRLSWGWTAARACVAGVVILVILTTTVRQRGGEYWLMQAVNREDAWQAARSAPERQSRAQALLDACQRSLDADPLSLHSRERTARYQMLFGQHRESAEAFRAALELEPNSKWIHNDLGVELAADGRLDEARLHYHAALEIDRTQSRAWRNLGVNASARGRNLEAAVRFAGASLADPLSSEAHRYRAVEWQLMADRIGGESQALSRSETLLKARLERLARVDLLNSLLVKETLDENDVTLLRTVIVLFEEGGEAEWGRRIRAMPWQTDRLSAPAAGSGER